MSASLLTRQRVPTAAQGVTIALGALFLGFTITLAPISPLAFWLMLLWGTWTVALIWALTRSPFSLAFGGLSGLMLLYVVLPATADVKAHNVVIGGRYLHAGLVQGLQVAVAAQTALLVGAVLARAFIPRHPLIRLPNRLSARGLDRAAFVMLLLGFIGLGLYTYFSGATLRRFVAIGSGTDYGEFVRTAPGTKVGYFVSLEGIAGVALVLVTLRFTSTDRRGRTAAIVLTLVAAFLLLGQGQRQRFVVPAIACGLIWWKTTRTRIGGGRSVAVLGIVGLLVVSAFIGVARGGRQNTSYSIQNLWYVQFGQGSDLFTPLAALTETVPARHRYLNGSSYIEVLAFPVPRAWWHGKPQGSISEITTLFDRQQAGFAFPEFGEAYANLGITGVIIGTIIFGASLEGLWLLLSRSTSVRETVMLAVVIAVLLLLFTRGAVAPMVGTELGILVGTIAICRPSSPTLATVEQRSATARTTQ